MKHRSVIGFVIVAAVLFSLPQLAHDLRELKGTVGARMHRELLYAFLNMPAGEPTAVVAPAARPAESLLASCPLEKSGAAKARKVEATSRVEGREAGKDCEQSAMIGDPKNDPINEVAGVEVKRAAEKAAASLSEAKVATEVAMIIPPETGIDPRTLATSLMTNDVARVESDRQRVEARELRVAYNTAMRFEANGSEWQKATEEAVRQLKGLPGAYEFRVMREGAKVRVLKFKCGDCPSTAPRTPPAPLPPATFTSADWAGE